MMTLKGSNFVNKMHSNDKDQSPPWNNLQISRGRPQLYTLHCHCREFHGAPMAGSSFHYDRQISNEYQMTNAKNKCPPIISNATISGEDTQFEKDK